MKIDIRPEKEEDSPAIYEVNSLAFGQKDEAELVDRIRASSHYVDGLSIVAEIDDRIVGHILLSTISIESPEGEIECLGLAPMAVLPDFQKMGIGSELIRVGLKKCADLGYGLVIVLGHPTFYPKFGFIPASQMGIRVEFDEVIPDEAFMAYECIPGTWKYSSGVVKYPSTFNV